MGSVPNVVDGQIPTAEDWNSYFGVKADDQVFAGDSGTGGTRGLVPPPPAGTGPAGFVLKATGVWGPVTGGGGGGFDQQVAYAAPLTGDTVLMTTGTGVVLTAVQLIPATELATLTISLPPSPDDMTMVEISTDHAIDDLHAVTTDGSSINTNPHLFLTANGGISFRYRAFNNTWYRRF